MNFFELYEELNKLNEAKIYSKYEEINFEDFKNGKNNTLYIVGTPGSGKSTLADMLSEQYNAKVINLDNGFLGGITSTAEEDLEISWYDEEFWKHFPTYRAVFDGVCKYIDEHPEDLYAAENCPINSEKISDDYYDNYLAYAIEYANSHKNEKFIIEGVQLMDEEKGEFTVRKLLGENPSILFMVTPSNRVIKNILEREKAWGMTDLSKKKYLRKAQANWNKTLKDFRKTF